MVCAHPTNKQIQHAQEEDSDQDGNKRLGKMQSQKEAHRKSTEKTQTLKRRTNNKAALVS
jgi:hypothetical protein